MASNAKNSLLSLFIIASIIIGIILMVWGGTELYKLHTYIAAHCLVKSTNLVRGDYLYSVVWNVVVTDDGSNVASSGLVSIFDTTSTYQDYLSFTKRNWYSIGQSYPCYHKSSFSNNYTEIQWNRPQKAKAYGGLFGGLAILFFGIGVYFARRHYQRKYSGTITHNQLTGTTTAPVPSTTTTPRTEEGRESPPPPPQLPAPTLSEEAPPPSYNEAVQWLPATTPVR
ncbi:unnamed protein product [Didymodactylos carnosus]|uniref:Uncharacterized protein n=1 Tax=Didymodactylos carnosus TaxID=1234261 RepID=A0A816AXQ7_9BILA|nr:unnamed protein product [Didymodactylos carnosus]CAF1603470.1 unnamed protein product [Didymodactylos carnosus]CAF4348892.1 unnamed protein product [Didymodactylos carnosus]CAF4481925.1 unnamed protein product [Didymodactylos carnosus]